MKLQISYVLAIAVVEDVGRSNANHSNILHVLGGFRLIRSQVMSTSVHEKALLEPAENYRPISLLPIVSKVTERCACKRLYYHV